MDNNGRERFWNVLKNIHDNSNESVNMLMNASPWPKTLCRFRPVSGNSLMQLNDNKLFFSSADYYDDPFDTYFYIDVNQMTPTYEKMRNDLREGNEELMDSLYKIAMLTGQEPDKFANMLSNDSLDFLKLEGQLREVRNSIQRKLFSICFCEDEYNETLWLKYADNYKGFVLIYDLNNTNTYLCGKEEACRNCITAQNPSSIYPVYYSDERYDATKCALGILLIDKIIGNNSKAMIPFYNSIQQSMMWEFERISLIKKKCHENDKEWRMLRPAIDEHRSFIKMKPSKVIIGLRTPDHESRLIVSAAVNAGIREIHKLYINDLDKLDSLPVPDNLYRI